MLKAVTSFLRSRIPDMEHPYFEGDEFARAFDEEVASWVNPARKQAGRTELESGAVPDVSNNLVGLALSGGGIRSATFALGACQALARYGALERVDYLSTVSGGGYFATTLTAILDGREQGAEGHPLSAKNFDLRYDANRSEPEVESRLVRHLREHSNYLAPNAGLFDVGSWKAALNIFARLLCIWVLVLIPVFLAVSLAAVVFPDSVWPRKDPFEADWQFWTIPIVIVCAGLAGLTFICFLKANWASNPILGRALIGMILLPAIWAGFVLSVAGTYLLTKEIDDVLLSGLSIGSAASALLALLREVAVSTSPGAASSSTSTLAKLRSTTFKILFGLLGYGVLAVIVLFTFRLVDRHGDVEVGLALGSAAALALLLVFDFFSTVPLRALNWFSLKSLYQKRLSDSYLDCADGHLKLRARDLSLADVQSKRRNSVLGAWGPLHVIGTAINTAGERDQERLGRKSDALFLSCLRSGSSSTGFAWTKDNYPDLRLADAMAISGAAFSPNQGKYTNTTLSILLTLLNARLGQWVRNPRLVQREEGSDVRLPSPWASTLLFYIKEMFGAANSKDNYVYLSDGGHFDNTGIYELLRRRCRFIVAIDATGEESPENPAFGSFGELVRLARVDFGINIDIDLARLNPAPGSGRPERHFAVGKVIYRRTDRSPSDEDRTGIILWVKATMAMHSESVDLEYYRKSQSSFPNHSTSQQLFDEATFESYRELGYHSVKDIIREVFQAEVEPPGSSVPPPPTPDAEAFRELLSRWNSAPSA